MSTPISAISSWAPVRPMPGTSSSWVTWRAKGAIASSIRQRLDLRGQRIDVVEHHLQQVAVMVAEMPGQRHLQHADLAPHNFSLGRWTGVLEPLNDPAFFAQVIVDPEAGTVAWPNGIDLATEPLYEQASAHPLICRLTPACEVLHLPS